jgi:hypothetical protein
MPVLQRAICKVELSTSYNYGIAILVAGYELTGCYPNTLRPTFEMAGTGHLFLGQVTDSA